MPVSVLLLSIYIFKELSWHLLVSSIVLRRRQWQPTPVLLPGKSHGWRRLVGCSPWDRKESGTTERLHFHFSLWCIGEGNGNPLQCFCLENSVDRGIWWATIHGVQQESDTTERPIHTHISKNALAFVAVLWLRVFVNTDIDRYTDINTYINFYRIHRYRYLSI